MTIFHDLFFVSLSAVDAKRSRLTFLVLDLEAILSVEFRYLDMKCGFGIWQV
jgi:hypothetical protein